MFFALLSFALEKQNLLWRSGDGIGINYVLLFSLSRMRFQSMGETKLQVATIIVISSNTGHLI